MANKRHLALITQGTNVWNRWRTENRNVRPDLFQADLFEADLAGCYLRGADLNAANLSRANLNRANLSGSYLSRAYLSGATLFQTDFFEAYLKEANLSRAFLRDANLSKADLSGADLRGAHLRGADLNGANLSGAGLSDADLSGTELNTVNLCEADLSGANLHGASLRGADLRKADLCRTDLSAVDLSDADLTKAKIGWTVFGNVDLRRVEGLETLVHLGPSTIGVDTIFLSGNRIPEVFLRGAGVPEDFVAYSSSLEQPLDPQLCFISYIRSDKAFAERLYADLEAEGIRCWFASEDTLVEDRIQESVDISIRMPEKRLLILSENSVESEWMRKEVERAFKKERTRKTKVLVPVFLDGNLLNSDRDWVPKIKQKRSIFDFSGWDRDSDIYNNTLRRVLQQLTAK